MIELLFVVCLRADPVLCEERSIAYLPDVSLMSCMMTAPPQLALWSEQHPQHHVARWTCQPLNARGLRA